MQALKAIQTASDPYLKAACSDIPCDGVVSVRLPSLAASLSLEHNGTWSGAFCLLFHCLTELHPSRSEWHTNAHFASFTKTGEFSLRTKLALPLQLRGRIGYLFLTYGRNGVHKQAHLRVLRFRQRRSRQFQSRRRRCVTGYWTLEALRPENFLLVISTIQDEDITLPSNVGIRLPSDAASYARRTEPSQNRS